MIPSYPSIYNLGHRALAELLLDPVIVQEKVDGSQISFGVLFTPQGEGMVSEPELLVRSKGAQVQVLAPDKMFARAVAEIKARQHLLRPGWVYRGEYLAKPKHNTLAYDRVPHGHIALFDVDRGDQDYLNISELLQESKRLDFDCVPALASGFIDDVTVFRSLLDTTSFLGGQKIEGVVVKNYARYGPDKKVLMGKFVSEAFKEVHAGEWRKENPTTGDILQTLIGMYRTPARWQKALQHLSEAGAIEDSPRDIGKLIPEVIADVEREEAEAIKQALFSYAWPKLRRAVTAGLPEWYKDQLLRRQFEQEA